MAFNIALTLGISVRGPNGTSNPGGAGGLVFDRVSCLYFDPTWVVWRESGAPFGSAQTAFAVSAGALPPGIHLKHAAAGVAAGGGCGFTVNQFGIEGVPLATGVYTGSFGASGAYPGETFSITVSMLTYGGGPTTCPLINLSDLSGGFNAIPYTRTVAASNGTGPYTFDLAYGTLPTGLSLSSGGVLSGTPTVNGTSTFTVRATDANTCPGVREYTLTIAEPAQTQIRGSTQIKRASITEFELNESIAGDGLDGGNGTPLTVRLKADAGLQITVDELELKLDGPSLSKSAAGLKIAEPLIQADGGQDFTADQSMGNHRLIMVADPVNAQDAVNRRTLAGISVLTNGNPAAPELIFDSNGDVIMTGI